METTIRQTALEGAVHRVFGQEPTEQRDGNVFIRRMDIHDGRYLHYGRRVDIDDPSRMADTVNARQMAGKFIEHLVVQVGRVSVVAEKVKGTNMYEVHVYRGGTTEFKTCKTEEEISGVLKTVRKPAA